MGAFPTRGKVRVPEGRSNRQVARRIVAQPSRMRSETSLYTQWAIIVVYMTHALSLKVLYRRHLILLLAGALS